MARVTARFTTCKGTLRSQLNHGLVIAHPAGRVTLYSMNAKAPSAHILGSTQSRRCHLAVATPASSSPSTPPTSPPQSSQNVAGLADMQDPAIAYPNTVWPWQRAPPKTSLIQLDRQDHASQASLNAVEFVHWLAFPVGFAVAHYIFIHTPELAPYVGGDSSRVFCLMLGMLCQVMGGICGIMMHTYEGWQVTPFRNLLELPQQPTKEEMDQARVPEYNNSWLRAVAYHLLFSFQTLGLGLFSLGALGFSPAMQGLLAGSVALSLVGPRKPQLSEAQPRWLWRIFSEKKVNGVSVPIMPLSVWVFGAFLVNTLVNVWAYKVLFGPVVESAWPPGLLPFLAPLASEWWAVVPPLVVGAGGIIEGYFAESSFDQWVHGLAVVVLLVGVAMHLPLYWNLVHAAIGV